MEQGAELPLPHFLGQNLGNVVIGVAGVDNERKTELAGEPDLTAKDPLGDIAGSVAVMIVETRFADADAFGMSGEFSHGGEIRRPLARRLMRMRANGEENVVVPLGDFNHPPGLREGADGDHALDADGARALDDLIEVANEVGEIEMAMAVDQRRAPALGHYGTVSSTKRGKMPSGFGNRVPGASGASAKAMKSRAASGTAN